MSDRKTYIDLINDAWESYEKGVLSFPATSVYLYLLNLINRNRWQPISISDEEIATRVGMAVNTLKKYKREVLESELLSSERIGDGRGTKPQYSIPEKGIKNCHLSDKKVSNFDTFRENKVSKNDTFNEEKVSNFDTFTPYNNISTNVDKDLDNTKDIISPPNVVDIIAREKIDDDTPPEVEFFEENNPAVEAQHEPEIQPAVLQVQATQPSVNSQDSVNRFLGARARAAEQATLVMETFFAHQNSYTLESLCRKNRISPEQLREYVTLILEEWKQDGTCHDDIKGNFNLSDATRHLRNSIPIKINIDRRNAASAPPKTRQETRQEMLNNMMQNITRMAATAQESCYTPISAGIPTDLPF